MFDDLVYWNIEEMCGYKPLTTFYEDFGIAERFGKKAIQETFDNAFKYWKDDYKYATEIVMILNWKIWEHAETNPDLARFYEKLWGKFDNWCVNNLKGEELSYFYRTTD